MKVKLGILGARRGFGLTNGVRKRDEFEIFAICDKNKERLDKAIKDLSDEGIEGTLAFTDYDEMLDCGIDAVLVATDAPLHTEHTLKALSKGKHVLSEIPVIYSRDEAKILKDAVYSHPELVYMVGENCCFWENIKAMKRLHDDGKLGEIVYAESEYLHCDKTPDEYEPYADENYWRANLPAIRYLTHNLGPLLYILDDEVETVSCYVPDHDHNKYKKEKSVGIALFKTKKGTVIRIFICFGAYVGCDHNFALYGSLGTVQTDKTKELEKKHLFAKISEFPESLNSAIELPVKINSEDSVGGHGGADAKMLLEFIRCIREKEKPTLDVDFGIRISLPGIIAENSYKNGNASLKIPKI